MCFPRQVMRNTTTPPATTSLSISPRSQSGMVTAVSSATLTPKTSQSPAPEATSREAVAVRTMYCRGLILSGSRCRRKRLLNRRLARWISGMTEDRDLGLSDSVPMMGGATNGFERGVAAIVINTSMGEHYLLFGNVVSLVRDL